MSLIKIPAADDKITPRFFYEGEGGWNDGRLGQAYHLICAVLTEHEPQPYQNRLLAEIDALDVSLKDEQV